MKSSASSTAMKYWVHYKWVTGREAKPNAPREWSTLATSPIQCLNWFHEHLQKGKDIDGMRQVIRPKLLPSQYEITLFKRDGFAPYDIPVGGNPDLTAKKKPVKEVEAAFGFYPETVGVGQLS